MSNVEKITRSQFKQYMEKDPRNFRVDKIEKFKGEDGEGGFLGYLQPDGKSTKRIFIDTRTEVDAPWGIGKNPKTGKWGLALTVDEELKTFLNFIDDSVIDQLAERSQTLFGKKMDREKVEENYTRMVHANFSKEKQTWGTELLRLGVVMPGMKAKDGPLKMVDIDGEVLDVNKYAEDPDGTKHGFQGAVQFNPMFVWLGDKAASGCKAIARKITFTGDLGGAADVAMDVDPELVALARKRKAEAAAAAEEERGVGGNEDRDLGIDGSPPAKRASLNVKEETTEPGSPGWS